MRVRNTDLGDDLTKPYPVRRSTVPGTVCKFLLILGLLGCLASCQSIWPAKVAPLVAKVVPPARSSYESTQGPPKLEIRESLLEVFDDPELCKIVNQTLEGNPDLKQTRARFEELGYNFARVRGQLFPTVNGIVNKSRSRTPPTPPVSFFQFGLDASWEVDVWGGIRSETNAAKFDLRQGEADLEAIRQSLAAQTMQGWFDLVRATKLVELNNRRSVSFKKTVDLVERRFELGLASLGELKLAETDYNNAKADIEASKDARDQAARQLRQLTGCYPDKTLTASQWSSLNRTVPEGLTSDLICRRPDVVAAFNAIQAADARTDVAHKELFPTFVLTGSLGRQSSRLSDLFADGFSYWSIAKNVTAPIFNAHQLRNEMFASGKRAEQAFYNYQSVVLTALFEVENALGSEYYLAREEKARLEALASSRFALDRTRRDYEAGIADILTLLEAQRLTFTTEQSTIELRFSRLVNRVTLALALGHGT